MYSFYPPMQSPFMQQTPVMPQVPVQQDQDIQYVNGKPGAEAYQMFPNKKAILMDANEARFYIKQTDANGQATIKSFDFKETEQEKPKEYVTKEEFESFKASMKGGRHESNSSNDNRKQ